MAYRTPNVPLLTGGEGNPLNFNEPYYRDEFEFINGINRYIQQLANIKEDFNQRFELTSPDDNYNNLLGYGEISSALFRITRSIHEISHQARYLKPMNRRMDGITYDYMEVIRTMLLDTAACSTGYSVIVQYKSDEVIQHLDNQEYELAADKLDYIMAVFNDDIDKRTKTLEMVIIQIELLRRAISRS